MTTARRETLPYSLMVIFALMMACGSPPVTATSPGSATFAERFGEKDDPSILLGHRATRVLGFLPLRGEVLNPPWPGSHWPMLHDGINHRWDGRDSLSPVEKYQAAFGGSGLEDAVSREIGIDSAFGQICLHDMDCRGAKLCARRRGQVMGKCVELYAGMCDGWAIAAMLCPEPSEPKTIHNIVFKVNDQKALLSYAARGVQCRLLSLRCNETTVQTDNVGRPRAPACRDTNPGTFHLLLAHLIGNQQRSFIIDRSMDYEVYNHPVTGYQVRHLQAMSEQQAIQLLDPRSFTYPYNQDAVAWQYVDIDVTYVQDPPSHIDGALTPRIHEFLRVDNYRYILELNHQGEIIGGEWVGPSVLHHPDFAWIPREKPFSTAARALDVALINKVFE